MKIAVRIKSSQNDIKGTIPFPKFLRILNPQHSNPEFILPFPKGYAF